MNFSEYEDKLNAMDFSSAVQNDVRKIIFKHAENLIFLVAKLYGATKGSYINLFNLEQISFDIQQYGYYLINDIVSRLDDELYPVSPMKDDD